MIILLNIYILSSITLCSLPIPNILNETIPYIPDEIQNSNAIRFLLLSKQHSGTHFIQSIINQHPHIIMREEECDNRIVINYKQCFNYNLPYALGFHDNIRLQILNANHTNEKKSKLYESSFT